MATLLVRSFQQPQPRVCAGHTVGRPQQPLHRWNQACPLSQDQEGLLVGQAPSHRCLDPLEGEPGQSPPTRGPPCKPSRGSSRFIPRGCKEVRASEIRTGPSRIFSAPCGSTGGSGGTWVGCQLAFLEPTPLPADPHEGAHQNATVSASAQTTWTGATRPSGSRPVSVMAPVPPLSPRRSWRSWSWGPGRVEGHFSPQEAACILRKGEIFGHNSGLW